MSTPAPGTSVALYQSGGKTYAYESGTGGIDAIDVTDPTNPQLLETFGQNDLVNGQFGFNVAKVVDNELLVGTSNGNNGSVFNLLVYSLANPASPTLVSNTTIDYRVPVRPAGQQHRHGRLRADQWVQLFAGSSRLPDCSATWSRST